MPILWRNPDGLGNAECCCNRGARRAENFQNKALHANIPTSKISSILNIFHIAGGPDRDWPQ